MTQIAVKLPEPLLGEVDRLVASGRFDSRSQAVRYALEAVVRESRDREIDLAFARGFAARPESDEEMADATRLAIDAIEDEPWEKWW